MSLGIQRQAEQYGLDVPVPPRPASPAQIADLLRGPRIHTGLNNTRGTEDSPDADVSF